MNEQLKLERIRDVLIRLEETILFALIERAQFKQNPCIYEPGFFGDTAEESLACWMLHETEKIHAKVRRYTSPDEHPFFKNLPEPVLPKMGYSENPLAPNQVNINPVILDTYINEIVPHICKEGDDSQYGSSALCDVMCLQALSRRIHYGKFVAESKYLKQTEEFEKAIRRKDKQALGDLITHPEVEKRVLERVERKARTYGQDVNDFSGDWKIDPEKVVAIYKNWVIPLTKDVEIDYLLEAQREGSLRF